MCVCVSKNGDLTARDKGCGYEDLENKTLDEPPSAIYRRNIPVRPHETSPDDSYRIHMYIYIYTYLVDIQIYYMYIGRPSLSTCIIYMQTHLYICYKGAL